MLALGLASTITLGGFVLKGLLLDLAGPLPWQLNWSLLNGLLLGLIGAAITASAYVFAFTAWGHWLVFTRFRLPLLGRLPWRVNALLDDAYRRGVLRQSGAVYQFRHARLQEHLAKTYRG